MTASSRADSQPPLAASITPASAAINPAAEGASILNQALGLVAVIAWSAVGTFVVLMICRVATGLKVTREQEIEGLDVTQHGEGLH